MASTTTSREYTGDGSDLTWAYTFQSYQSADIKVEVTDATGTFVNVTNFTIPDYTTASGTITFNNTGVNSNLCESTGAPKTGRIIRIYRSTDITTGSVGEYDPKATYTAGSSVKAEDLNNNAKQALYAAFELRDQEIQRGDIRDDSIDGSKIADDAIDSEHYTAGSIDKEHLAINSVDSSKIENLTIVNEDISASAEITVSKLADGSARQILQTSASGSEVEWTSNIDVPGNLDVTGATVLDGTLNVSGTITGNVTGNITGNVTGNVSGSSGSCTGNAATATALASARTLGGVSFDGTGNINLPGVNASGTQDTSGNAATATDLAAAAKITNSEQAAHSANDSTYFTTSASDARYFNVSTGDTIKDGDAFPDNDTTIATTAAINDRIIDLVDDVGGFTPITNETSFPAANPDVNNGAGTIVSIQSLASTHTPSNGTVTISNGAGTGNTVSITHCGNTVLTAGFGCLVETTTTLHTYKFHRLSPKATEVTTVAGISGNITTVAGISSNVTTVAGISSNVTTVAGNNSNVTTVAGKISDVETVSDNISAVENFSDLYQIDDFSPSAPTTDGGGNAVAEGDLAYDSTANRLKVYTGSAWESGVTAPSDLISKDIVDAKGDLITASADNTVVRTAVGADGKFLKADSGATGGVSWDTVTQTDTTYTHTWQDSSDNAILRLTAGGSGSGNDDLTIVAGDNITLTPSGDNLTIAASGGEVTVQDEGSSLSTAATTLNFTGSGVTASGTGSTKTISISGGGTDFQYLDVKDASNASNAPSYPVADFKLVTAGTTTEVSPTAANTLLISVNGVIQKPNTGTSTPAEGFAINGSTIKFGANLAAAPDFIVYAVGSGIGTPSNNTVTAAKLDLSLVAGDIIYGTGTDTWARLPKGSDGEVLKLASGVPSWAADNATDATKMPLAGGTFTGDVTWDNGTNAGKDMIWDESDDTLKLNDDVQISLGSDRDMRLYHTGSHAYFNVVTGDLNIRTSGTESAIVCTKDAGVATYHNGVKKTETTSAGLDITGNITISGTVDGIDIATDVAANTAKVTNATHTGDVTGATSLTIANNAVNLDKMAGVARGALITGDSNGDPKYLTVGSDNHVLTVDSNGDIGWEAAAAGGVTSDAQNNTVAGTNAGDSFTGTDAINNSFYGKDAGTAVTSGDENVAIGFESFKSATTAAQNTCVGSKAGKNITGGNNVCVGFRAGEDATSADSCIAIGKSAYDGANTGNENIAIGVGSMGDAAVCTGQRNICIGTDTGKNITGGEYNVAIGYQALDASVEGGSNTAVGAFALSALDSNTTGNVAVGMKAGMTLDADHSTFIGWKCGEDADSGYHNTGVGSQCLMNVSTGYSSTGVGYQALKTITTGLEATAIGYQAGLDYNANGGVFVGRWAGKTNATDQNTILYIARNADSAGNNGCWIYGNDTGQCFNGDNDSHWATTSDQRLKKDIVDNNVGLSVIDNIKVRNFKYKQYDKSDPVLYTEEDQEVKDGLIEVGEEKSPSIFTTPKTSDDTIDLSGFKAGTIAHNVVIGQGKTGTQIGVIAQEIEAVCPGCVKTDDFGAKTVCTDELFWHMINAIKELSTKVKALEAK